MSLILDALKRSETERHENTATDNLAEYTAQPSPASSLVPWMVAAILMLNIAAIAWLLIEKPWQQTVVVETATPPKPIPETVAKETPAAEPIQAESPPKPPARPSRPLAQEQLTQPEPNTAKDKSATRSLMQQQNISATKEKTTQTAKKDSETSKTEPESTISADVLRLADTPSNIRDQLNSLEINAHVYSDNRQKRFVLINLKKHREGDQLGDFVLEQILANGLVINYGDGRALLPLNQQHY